MVALGLGLSACDPGGRLAQLTPQPTVTTPQVPDVTAESPGTSAPVVQTPAPLPTATYDPARPSWTVLYYAGADNDRAAFVWDDLNEMEAGGLSEQVTVVAQVDWAAGSPAGTEGSVRYRLRADDDRQQLVSESVVTLGETNQGDPVTLADFLVWGISTYPANRYLLVLGDYGGGWVGCCVDATGVDGQTDHLSLTDLDQALAFAQGQTGARFEVIAFAAGLMSQLDVLQTFHPYAAYMVASPGLVPGSAWDYQAVLSQLNAEPLVDGRQLAGDLVTAYVNSHRQLNGDEFVSMAAVDLSRVPTLSGAVESLAAALAADSSLYSQLAYFARRGAPSYGNAALSDADRIAAVDLSHAAALIAEVSPPGDAQTAATAVGSALTEALVAFDHGMAITAGRGVALYWPAGTTPDPLYLASSRLPSWAAFLTTFVSATAGNHAWLTLEGGTRETVHIAQPALMRAELVADRTGAFVLVADQEAADGRRVLRQYEEVEPAPLTLPGGTQTSLWRDGWHESLVVWDATGGYLSDGSGAGDYTPLQSVDPSPLGAQLAVAGQFRRAASAAGHEATVVFAPGTAASAHIWQTASADGGARLIGEVLPAAGDVFQPSLQFVGMDGVLGSEPGISLVFDAAPAIYRSARPLPAGSYTVALWATAPGSPPRMAGRRLIVDPAQATAGFRAYVDVSGGVQFLYPADWLPPTTQEGVSFTRNISGTMQLQVRTYPDWPGDLAGLHSEVLSTFGQVSVLQQDSLIVGSVAPAPGILTAYGYDSPDQGARTGTFVSFLNSGTGYVIDLDGPRAAEAETMATLNTVAATWQFLEPRLGFGPEPWSLLNVGEFRVRYPAGYAYQEHNQWHRFTVDAQTFVAVRLQPAARTAAEAMAGLLQTAAEGVAGFSAEEPQQFFYGGHVWQRNDFTYVDPGGQPVRGLLLSRQDGETEIAVWGEGPDGTEDFITTFFLPTAAGIERIIAAPSG